VFRIAGVAFDAGEALIRIFDTPFLFSVSLCRTSYTHKPFKK